MMLRLGREERLVLWKVLCVLSYKPGTMRVVSFPFFSNDSKACRLILFSLFVIIPEFLIL